ncbi:MAG: hypothetical protein BGO43_00365 [Gammaproteobacteria bacterium 39-13]|nr:F-box protein [Gammaproteobacteria bacterium]OJV96714.1 MAG: hypothetical protein BGO43_00365 [Gammaproteobacteria bacterium 39-13]
MHIGPEYLDDTTLTDAFSVLSYLWDRLVAKHSAEAPITDKHHPLYRPFTVLPEEILQHILSFLPIDKKLYLKGRLIDKKFKETIDKETFKHIFASCLPEEKRYEILWSQQGNINSLLLSQRAKIDTDTVDISFKKAFHRLENTPENMSYFNLYLRSKAIEGMQQAITLEANKSEQSYPIVELESDHQDEGWFELEIFGGDFNSKMYL